MYAVVGRSTLHDLEQATAFLRERAPGVRQAPGFVAAQWVKIGDSRGASMLTFESEDAARAAVEQFKSNLPPENVITFDSIEIGEVVARI